MLYPIFRAASVVISMLRDSTNNELDLEKLNGEYDKVLDFKCNRAAVCKDGKWGYINEKGKLIIPLRYEQAYSFFDDFASVYLTLEGKKKGIIIDRNGNWFTIPAPEFRGPLYKTESGPYTIGVDYSWDDWDVQRSVTFKDGKFVNNSGYSYNNPRYPNQAE